MYQNEREGEGYSFVPFDANQIKSATGNNGNFDTSEEDITKSEGGDVEKKGYLDSLHYGAPRRKSKLVKVRGNPMRHWSMK